jgi:dTMP kinase
MALKFITLEGCEGAGKSTQAKLLAKSFEQAGYEVVLTREPGGTELAERIRNFIFSEKDLKPISELLLMNAARYEHVQDVIAPALKQGKIVICDRFVDSTMAYQGYAQKIGKKLPALLHNFLFPEIAPDMTLILDIDPALGIKRSIASKEKNKFEDKDLAFHERVRVGFNDIAKNAVDRCITINAAADVSEIHSEIISQINELCMLNLKTV